MSVSEATAENLSTTSTTREVEAAIEPFRDELLPELVRFWNRVFGDRRNFFPMTADLFTERVVEKHYNEEPFDPAGLLLAIDQDTSNIVGMVHCGLRSERFCRTVYNDWQGGGQAYVGIIAVEKPYRRHGIGTALWSAAKEYARSRGYGGSLVIDSQCLNPCYGNSDGLYSPPWGTAEGIAIDWEDEQTKRFLARRGHRPEARAVSMECALGGFRPFRSGARRLLGRDGLSLEWTDNRSPGLGSRPEDTLVSGSAAECGALCCVNNDSRVVALVAAYPMSETDDAKVAIYDFETLPEYRGRGIGKAILWALLERFRDRGFATCEVLTIPQMSPGAYVLYRQAGFRPVARWAIY